MVLGVSVGAFGLNGASCASYFNMYYADTCQLDILNKNVTGEKTRRIYHVFRDIAVSYTYKPSQTSVQQILWNFTSFYVVYIMCFP